jgi:hypothetical protein
MKNFDEFESDDEMIGWLEEQGALIWDGMDETGDPMFKFDMDILKDVCPPLYDTLMEDIDNDLLELYKAGLVEIEYDENQNGIFINLTQLYPSILNTIEKFIEYVNVQESYINVDETQKNGLKDIYFKRE